MNSKDKSGKHQAQIIDPGLGDLEKVRNILFGRQARSFEERVDQLESKMHGVISDLESKIDQRFVEFENVLSEHTKLVKSDMNTLEEDSSSRIQEVNTQVEQLSAAVGTDLAQLKGELNTELRRIEKHLTTSKTDKETLAMMFDEMSIKLRGIHK